MAYSRKKPIEKPIEENKEDGAVVANEIDQVEFTSEIEEEEEEEVPPTLETLPELPSPPKQKTGKIFLSEEDKRLLKRFNNHIIKKLNLQGSRSVKI